jgi:hypothetical protein
MNPGSGVAVFFWGILLGIVTAQAADKWALSQPVKNPAACEAKPAHTLPGRVRGQR